MQGTQVLDSPMTTPKKTGRPATSTRDDVVVKIDKRIAAKARFVASDRNIPAAEYLSDLLRALVDRDFEKATKGAK